MPGSAQRVYGCGPITSIGYDSDGAGFVAGPEHVPPKYKYTGMNWNVPKKLTQIETGMRTSLGHRRRAGCGALAVAGASHES